MSRRKKGKINETEFFTVLTKTIINSQLAQTLADKLTSLFREYIGIKDMRFLVRDMNTGTFRDFAKDWVYVRESESQIFLYSIYKSFQTGNKEKFVLNGKFYAFDDKIFDCKPEACFKDEDNVIYYPLSTPNEAVGLVEITFDKLNAGVKFDGAFLKIFYVSLLQISNAVLNYIAHEAAANVLSFYDAMKNIAKITENQYEPAYIIPQIGEMIDRFISAHLIYVFVKDTETGELKLYWPKACKEKEIFKMLDRIDNETEYLISPDEKIGIFPLHGEEEMLGAIAAYSNFGKLTREETEYLLQLSKQSGITLQRASMYAEVLKHATLDALTGLNNRRQMEIRLKQAVSASVRKNEPLCCLMLDVDYFKKINDTYGHATGDIVLKTLAEVITGILREYDVACRYGGEEFLVILPDTKSEEAASAAQRLLKTVRNKVIDISETAGSIQEPVLNITVSIGVAQYKPGQTADAFCACADKALYAAKKNGRNRVIVYGEDYEDN